MDACERCGQKLGELKRREEYVAFRERTCDSNFKRIIRADKRHEGRMKKITELKEEVAILEAQVESITKRAKHYKEERDDLMEKLIECRGNLNRAIMLHVDQQMLLMQTNGGNY